MPVPDPTAPPIRLALVEDNADARELLATRLGFFDAVDVVAVAASAEGLLDGLEKRPPEALPQVVLMDIELPGMDGVAATARLSKRHPSMEVIMLTVFEDEDRIFSAVRAGASGYLLKDASAERIVAAVEDVAAGGAPVSPLVARKLMGFVRGEPPEDDDVPELTPRETEVLVLIAEGATEKVVGDRLHISPHTVRGHVKNLYRKLQVHSRGEAVRTAYERRLLR